ncbi:hypothetical protein BDN70DRAFT_878505 [Pholiota conissans]|uniref:Transcription activator of gluconeogenesis ERT1 n=1 Tax=Pholiota conissans TaxID=109636 RepID=A0A9P6D0V3_9AGAR|nr:hypothetical protein BDN70DRAFT_878505 [Pholiota conissans]
MRFMSASLCLSRGALPSSCLMPSVADKSLEGDEPPSYTNSSPQHPDNLSGMPLHVYPIPNSYLPPQQPLRTKRRQVKNACTHCQKACKKCDDARPCLRCVKYGVSDECVDSQRKERKKGIKRGPYKKRDGKATSVDCSDVPPSDVPVHSGIPPAGVQPIPYMALPGYPAGFYGQYTPLLPKQGDGHPPYPPTQYILASLPHSMQSLQGMPDDDSAYPPQGFYPTTVLPIPYHPQYAIAQADGSAVPHQYPVYSDSLYHKETLTSGEGEVVNGAHVRTEVHGVVNNEGA